MTEIEERIRQEIAGLRDPVTNAPLIYLEASIEVKELAEGTIYIVYYSRDPYSANTLTLADAVKKIASRVGAGRKIVVEVRNHFMADFLNLKLNT